MAPRLLCAESEGNRGPCSIDVHAAVSGLLPIYLSFGRRVAIQWRMLGSFVEMPIHRCFKDSTGYIFIDHNLETIPFSSRRHVSLALPQETPVLRSVEGDADHIKCLF